MILCLNGITFLIRDNISHICHAADAVATFHLAHSIGVAATLLHKPLNTPLCSDLDAVSDVQ